MKIIQIKRKNLDTLKEFLFIAHVCIKKSQRAKRKSKWNASLNSQYEYLKYLLKYDSIGQRRIFMIHSSLSDEIISDEILNIVAFLFNKPFVLDKVSCPLTFCVYCQFVAKTIVNAKKKK